jgi:VCBS repeat-containing protein
VFTPAPNANGAAYASFTFQVQDDGGTANGGVDLDPTPNTITVNVNAVNDAPVLDPSKSPVLAAVAEDAAAPVGAVGTLVSALIDLFGGGGLDNASDVDSGAVTGIALTGTNSANGTWYYSTDNGVTWTAVGAVSTSSALLLAADSSTRVYFQPNANFNGTISDGLTFKAWDQTSGTNGGTADTGVSGGTTAFSTAVDTAAITVTPVNDPAVIGGDDQGLVTEATAANPGDPDDTGTLTAADIDNPPNKFQPAAGTTTYGSYTMSSTGQWTYLLDNNNSIVNALVAGAFLIDSFVVYSDDGTAHTVQVRINGANDVIVVTPPPTFTGADPNDFDTLVGTGTVNNNDTVNGEQNTNDNITGGTADQNIDGKGGNDTIYGGGGVDRINGNIGDDTLYGQAGNDEIDGNNGLDAIYGGSGNDNIVGGNDADTIYGGSGNDVIVGQNGNDIIIGGFGADTLTGGGDNDTFKYLDVRDTNDTILDFMVSGSDFIDLSAIDADPGTLGNDAFAWGGTTPTANGAWYAESDGNTVLYADTDGNAATAEFMITLQGFSGWGTSYDQAVDGPPPGVIL